MRLINTILAQPLPPIKFSSRFHRYTMRLIELKPFRITVNRMYAVVIITDIILYYDSNSKRKAKIKIFLYSGRTLTPEDTEVLDGILRRWEEYIGDMFEYAVSMDPRRNATDSAYNGD
jgi:uridine kinase